ncbi:MAG: hypothetical protein EAY76_02420 [Alphaproteobacteria bacterium]|nr:MAG: hypothetical protein EAY76_02420 [Alphaproteobacteria bacterium]TAF40633.1 MAG: hypothetical protein EAZ66_02740 [Alphaproteobacteria bacterium]TAF75930.1 MAG: hypothetical protein EAZ52_05550 [Alphaproteobacteria bacterium]
MSDAAFLRSLLDAMIEKKQKEIAISPKEKLEVNAVNVQPVRGKPYILTNSLKKEIRSSTQGFVTHLGIVIDADYPTSDNGMLGKGYADTLAEVESRIIPHGYPAFSRVEHSSGWITHHPDSDYCTIGLWIMPNNQDDGMLEDFMITNLKQEYASFMQEAKEIIETKQEQDYIGKYDVRHHQSKAQFGTWKSWYHKPDDFITIDKMDDTKQGVKHLKAWLRAVYNINEGT